MSQNKKPVELTKYKLVKVQARTFNKGKNKLLSLRSYFLTTLWPTLRPDSKLIMKLSKLYYPT